MDRVTYMSVRLPALSGRTALMRDCPGRPALVQLQFDGYDGEPLPLGLTHGWLTVLRTEVVQ